MSKNGEELLLPGLNLTQKQLFWVEPHYAIIKAKNYEYQPHLRCPLQISCVKKYDLKPSWKIHIILAIALIA